MRDCKRAGGRRRLGKRRGVLKDTQEVGLLEDHHRRAVGGLVYLSWLGPAGIAEVGARSHALAEHAKHRLGLPAAFDRPTLREFVVRTGKPAREVIDACKRLGVHPGYAIGRDYDGLDDALMLAFTERRTVVEIERLAEALESAGVELGGR